MVSLYKQTLPYVESFYDRSACAAINDIHAQNNLDVFVTPIPSDLTIELCE